MCRNIMSDINEAILSMKMGVVERLELNISIEYVHSRYTESVYLL